MVYFEQIKREMDGTVSIIDHVDQSSLRQYYAACKVHALVSWMETTGLSSLEAAAMGANIVITDKGDTRDYFGNLAYYCAPDSIPSIREALLRAHSAPRSNLLQDESSEQLHLDSYCAGHVCCSIVRHLVRRGGNHNDPSWKHLHKLPRARIGWGPVLPCSGCP